jgi:hypothetical protein
MASYIIRLLICGGAFIIFSCSASNTKYIAQYASNNIDRTGPDYSSLYDWAAHPWKKDLSDSVPKPLLANYSIDSTVDVFFLYPTSLTDMEDNRWNAPINDAAINVKTDYGSILYQASAFNEYRVFAPRYRQAHLRCYYTTDTVAALRAFELAYQDIKTAFAYYLQNYNNGRPIVIAAHSQGSTHAQRLLKEFFETSPLKNKLVAAYVIGMYIPNTYFAILKVCNDAIETGCLCGWRTYKEGYKPAFVIKENGTGLITNPLTGSTNPAKADYSLNNGSVLTKFNKVKKHVTNAQIKDGVLWIDRLKMPGGFLVRRKNFHVGDINLFYVNIREDVKRRVGLFWKSK